MNFANKYRPKAFNEVVGQEHIKKTILTALRKGDASHAFLFCGGRGTGKTTLARLIAKALNCLNPQNGEPCNQCEMCLAATEGRLVDLIEIDAASHTSVDNVRELIEKMQFQPTYAKRKIHIIDEVHMLSRSAFNALLKTLEEPPSHVYFILATTERHKIPETIQSRCQIFNFRHLTKDEMAGRLREICERENIKADRDALLTLANEAAGGMRDAISLLEQYGGGGELTSEALARELGLAPHTMLESLYEHIQEKRLKEAIDNIAGLANEGLSLSGFSRSFLHFLRNKMLVLVENEETENLAAMLEIIRIFSRAHVELKNAVIPTLPLETALVAIIHGETTTDNLKKEESGSWFSFGKKTEPREKPKAPEEKPVVAMEKPIEKPVEAVFEAPEINLEILEKVWPQILDKIAAKPVKMNLRFHAKPTAADGEKIVLSFASAAMKEKIEALEAHRELAKALEEIFRVPLKIETRLEEIRLEPVENVEKSGGEGGGLNKEQIEEAIDEIFGKENA